MDVFDLNQPASLVSEEDDVAASNLHVVSVSRSINIGCDSFCSHDDNTSSSNSLKTPKAVIHHEFIDTPGGSVYWVPRVSASVLPVLGTVYDSLDEFIEIYRKYASEAGFGTRLSYQKQLKCGYVKQKYVVCNREGCPKDVWLNTLDPNKNDRQVRSSNFRVCGCKAHVVFDVKHNHELDRVEYKHFYDSVIRCLKGIVTLGCTQIKFQEFTLAINCFIGGLTYAQLTHTRIEQRQEYKMVFVPFTAIDNHRRSVTVGSGLLKKETAEAYGWLLRAFKKAFVRPPNIVVTDQDGAMRLAVAAEFPESKHRLCMWHIMQKIPAKIVSRIYDDTNFKDKFGKIVCNMFIRPEEFEDRWNKLMEELNLVNHKWLSKMYLLRSSWVPAFFVDYSLCVLMRTTSSLQWKGKKHTQEKLDHQSFDSFPALLTPLPIKEHAAKVYTRNLFIYVQKDIVAGSWLCSITGMSSDEGCTVCIIDEEKIKHVGLPEVIDKESTSENVEEEINLHQKVTGHYKNFKVFCILDQYILRRWTKDLIPSDLRKKNCYGEKNEVIEKLAMEASIILDSCVHMLRNNEPKLSMFVNKMKAIKSDLEAELTIVLTRTVSDFVQEFMGVKKPDKVKVKNPTGVIPKGREKQKHIKSGREISMKKSMKKSNKKKNSCSVCGSTAHNRRTCPQKNDANILYPVVVVPGGSDHVDGGLRDGASGSVSV
ncbi:FAR1-related sequence 5-like protein [Tanacetum coccineum]